jgi:class 3 adenylate cyclase
LFTDVVGSTRLSSDLDPEDTLAIMDTALSRFSGLIEQNSGRVLRFMGDGLKAVFGAPISQEDDAERAVRAGLALLRDCQAYSQEVETKWGVGGFNIRVGIHSGRVLLGGGVEAEKAAMGMPINLAARMESSAPPGNLRISSDTYRLVRGLFEVEEQEPIQVKGREAPMRTYLVRSELPRAFHPATRGLPGGESPMVGREAELDQLKAAYQSVVQSEEPNSSPSLVEPGVGKSRLLDEYTRWLETGPLEIPLFSVVVDATMTNTPYALLNDLQPNSISAVAIRSQACPSYGRAWYHSWKTNLFSKPTSLAHWRDLVFPIAPTYSVSRMTQSNYAIGPYSTWGSFSRL